MSEILIKCKLCDGDWGWDHECAHSEVKELQGLIIEARELLSGTRYHDRIQLFLENTKDLAKERASGDITHAPIFKLFECGMLWSISGFTIFTIYWSDGSTTEERRPCQSIAKELLRFD